jgi:hypothetical protein
LPNFNSQQSDATRFRVRHSDFDFTSGKRMIMRQKLRFRSLA